MLLLLLLLLACSGDSNIVAGAYHSIFALVPDYNVGVIVLVAGGPVATADRTILFQALMSILVPALEATAKSQAKASYTIRNLYHRYH